MSETKEQEFLRKLKHGKEEWEHFPANQEYPCIFGCIVKRRIAPPHDFSLSGDCRVPYSQDCCMNKQDKNNR